jgi:hypothetical protein
MVEVKSCPTEYSGALAMFLLLLNDHVLRVRALS